jgi:glycosyltransferase involved in cell wall biosynthesis
MKVVIAHGGNIGFQGGGTLRVLTFAKSLAERGYDVSLVVPKPVGNIPEDVRESVRIYTVPVVPRGLWSQITRAIFVSLKAKKLAEKEGAILQIEHSTLGGIASLLGCSNYVLDVHDLEFDGDQYRSIPLASKGIYYLERRAVKKASKIIAVSDVMKDFISKEWGIEKSKIDVIPNGVRSKILNFKTDEKEEEGLVSFLGVLTHNIDYEKIFLLSKELEKTRIFVIGDGPMRCKLLKRLKGGNIANVIVPGYLPDEKAYGILARSQVCIFPLRDTFHTRVAAHMKAFDYAALGKAIATDRDATARVFEMHDAALVSDPSKPEEFVENVRRLLNDEGLRKRLGMRARKLAENFTWEKQGEKLVRLYELLRRSV